MVFLWTRMCAQLKSLRKDQQDYIKAKLVAGTPLQLTNRLLVWRPIFLPDQSVRHCGYCCCCCWLPGLWLWVTFRAFLAMKCRPFKEAWNPLFLKGFLSKWRKLMRLALCIVLGMFWDFSRYPAYGRMLFFAFWWPKMHFWFDRL